MSMRIRRRLGDSPWAGHDDDSRPDNDGHARDEVAEFTLEVIVTMRRTPGQDLSY
jgi:hypothetical protein